jgi:hypothetical protein
MLEYKSIVSLTIDEARVLLEPWAIEILFPGLELENLPQTEDTHLVDALSSPELPADVWRRRLAGLHVSLLDINRVSAAVLTRVAEGQVEIVDLLLEARPYFSLADLAREDNTLGKLIERAAPYFAHEGYWFQDKPKGKLVELFPVDSGVIVRYRQEADFASVRTMPQETELVVIAHDPVERLLVCRWQAELAERPAHLFMLKRSNAVETVAPFLKDEQGQERFVYPDRLDLALHPESDEARWNDITAHYGLQTVERYMRNYGSVRVMAHPHDLGALYRTLRALVNEPVVRYVEPTHLFVGDS